ncbi:hypothetical protein FKW77_002752 [Venturia effusa]|uniref:Vacuolar protein sorting-associated protein 62 n=1 Tax=Venturia effusa TaxID=50376 RepID=A0A517LL31_9PEZI|nr:hypothetical protein FKW77_002752 [Venturia effusa]
MSYGRLVGRLCRWALLPLVLAITSTREADDALMVPDYVIRHAPLVWLHSEDPFRPSDFGEHLKHTTAKLYGSPIPKLPILNLDNLELLNDYGKEVALTSNDDVTIIPQWLLGETPNASGAIETAIPCAIIMLEKTSRDVDVYYFYFYSYDRGANITQVLPPLNRIVSPNETEKYFHFGDHVGDWENNMIRFRDGLPTGIYYSQHSDGQAFDWNDDILQKESDRPVVYSAYGSHANYATNGTFVHDDVLLDYCNAGLRWDPVQSAYFYRLNQETFTVQRLFTNDEVESRTGNLTSWFYYEGKWGDAQYPDSDPRQRKVPHFGLPRFVSGPTGPRAKQLIRRGLYPDHRHKKTWVQIGIEIVMLEGWKRWAAAIIAIVLLGAILAAIVLGIVWVVRLVRRGIVSTRGEYQMVGTEEEIPMTSSVSRTGEDPRYGELA